MIIVVNLLI